MLISWFIRWYFFVKLEVLAEHSSKLGGTITCSTLLICQLHLWIWYKHVFIWLVEALLLGILCNAVTILLFCNLSFWSGALFGNLKGVSVCHIVLVLLRLLVLHILIDFFINLIKIVYILLLGLIVVLIFRDIFCNNFVFTTYLTLVVQSWGMRVIIGGLFHHFDPNLAALDRVLILVLGLLIFGFSSVWGSTLAMGILVVHDFFLFWSVTRITARKWSLWIDIKINFIFCVFHLKSRFLLVKKRSIFLVLAHVDLLGCHVILLCDNVFRFNYFFCKILILIICVN